MSATRPGQGEPTATRLRALDDAPGGGLARVGLAGRLLGPWLAVLFRVGLGAVFVVASLDKIAHPEAFARSISYYRMVPLAAINLMAICLPWIELGCGALLILGLATRANLLVINVLLAVFIVAILSAMRRHLDISCGCFSTDPSSHTMTRATLTWDIVWLAMGLHALFLDRGHLSLGGLLRRRSQRQARR